MEYIDLFSDEEARELQNLDITLAASKDTSVLYPGALFKPNNLNFGKVYIDSDTSKQIVRFMVGQQYC